MAIKYKPSPLVQGGLEIPIEVTVKWDDKNAVDILRKKVEEVPLLQLSDRLLRGDNSVSYPLIFYCFLFIYGLKMINIIIR